MKRSVGVFVASIALVLGVAVASPAQASAPAAAVAAPAAVVPTSLSGFSAGNLMSDAVFFAKGTMTEAQIQAFLQAKVPACKSGYTCLKDWYDTSRTTKADAMCGAYSGGTRERASRIIYKVAQACGINPQVILVTLQKEQSLVLSTAPTATRYRIAMGQGCPDTAACDTRYYGFFNQVYGAAWQFKRYANPPGTSQYFTWYAPGKTWNVRYHPNTSCGSKATYIQNQATANLYYYTPYQPNAAALKAGYGTGDSCSAYGNRNFYNYFTDWFGSTQVPTNACAQPPKKEVTAAGGEYTVTAATLNARSAPSTVCVPIARTFTSGTVVTRVATWGEWWQVRYDGRTYWVHSDYVTAAPAVAYKTSRVAGADRFETAVAVSKKSFAGTAPILFIASGEEYPDALTAGAAAGHLGGSLLLTRATTLPPSVASEIARLKPAKIVVVGGTGRVSMTVTAEIRKIVPGAAMSRIAGIDRYETSRLLATTYFGGATTAYIATGESYPDAMAASALGAALDRPVILVRGHDGAVDAATVKALKTVKATTAVIAGSTATVSSGIAKGLNSAGLTAQRQGGIDRYETSRLLAAAAYPSGAKSALLATGENYPDALAGAVLAAAQGAPLFTTPKTCLRGATKDWFIAKGVTGVTLIGQTPSLSDAVARSVRC